MGCLRATLQLGGHAVGAESIVIALAKVSRFRLTNWGFTATRIVFLLHCPRTHCPDAKEHSIRDQLLRVGIGHRSAVPLACPDTRIRPSGPKANECTLPDRLFRTAIRRPVSMFQR